MKKTVILLLYAFFLVSNTYGQVFTKVDSIQFSNAQIWGVCSDDGDSLCVTTTFTPGSKPHIFMRKVNYTNIAQQSPLKQLTFDADFVSIPNLTDHKSIIHNNEIYVAFSTVGDQDLFLFKTDINGNRIGNIVTVVSGSPDPTNDMILVTDGAYIYVLHFDPPFQHHVYKYDFNLNPVGTPFTTTINNHNNIGNAIFMNNKFHMFTGNTFGFNANLVYTTWDNSWAPVSTQNIVNSVGGDGNWFSTGVVYDAANQRWYIAMNHINNGQSIGQEHIDLLAFDNSFNLLERRHVTNTNYTRPHLVLKNGYLYMTYDRPGTGVYLHKYQIQNVTSINQLSDHSESVQIYPNPLSSQATLYFNKKLSNATLTIHNLLGQKVAEIENISGESITINRNNLPKGMYFVRIMQENQIIATEKIIITE